MNFKKRAVALAFFALFFLQPALERGQVWPVVRAIADQPTAACFPSLYSDVDFRWAFAFASTRDGKRVTSPVTRDMALQSGDRLKMMVELQKRCFVYLFHDDASSGIKLLFPYSLQQYTEHYQPGRKYYVPRNGWFRLDNTPGREVFYLIASATRLDGLEKAYLQYGSAVGDAKTREGQRLLERIQELSRQRRQLCTPAERPVTIGGALRSVQDSRGAAREDIAAFADEIVSKGLTARTYTIEHQ